MTHNVTACTTNQTKAGLQACLQRLRDLRQLPSKGLQVIPQAGHLLGAGAGLTGLRWLRAVCLQQTSWLSQAS